MTTKLNHKTDLTTYNLLPKTPSTSISITNYSKENKSNESSYINFALYNSSNKPIGVMKKVSELKQMLSSPSQSSVVRNQGNIKFDLTTSYTQNNIFQARLNSPKQSNKILRKIDFMMDSSKTSIKSIGGHKSIEKPVVITNSKYNYINQKNSCYSSNIFHKKTESNQQTLKQLEETTQMRRKVGSKVSAKNLFDKYNHKDNIDIYQNEFNAEATKSLLQQNLGKMSIIKK